MTRLPEHITFTGLDKNTDMGRVAEISARYPVEWGVLFSPSREGKQPRYPGWNTRDYFPSPDLRLAAHLCGGAARTALLNLEDTQSLLRQLEPYGRVQINYAPNPINWSKGSGPQLRTDTGMVLGFWEASEFQDRLGKPVILQSRSVKQWPDVSLLPVGAREQIQFLYDLSGGRGAAPAKWPAHPGGDKLVGYAGGIGPDNVASVLQAINSSGPYWIDMEGRVRDQDDWLDLDKVEAVCAAVYG